MLHVIAYDIGTTGVKTGLISIGETVELVADAYQGYDLYILENGGAEQDADQWWSAMCVTTRSLMKKSPVPPEKIDGISFCSQMQGLVLVNKGESYEQQERAKAAGGNRPGATGEKYRRKDLGQYQLPGGR